MLIVAIATQSTTRTNERFQAPINVSVESDGRTAEPQRQTSPQKTLTSENRLQTAVIQRSRPAESAFLRRFLLFTGNYQTQHSRSGYPDGPADNRSFSIQIKNPDTWKTSAPRAGRPPGRGRLRLAGQDRDIPSGIPLLSGSVDFWLRVSKGRGAGRTFQRCEDKEAL